MDLLKNNHLLFYGAFSFALLFANIEKWQSTAKSFVLYNGIFIFGAFLKKVLGIPLDGEEILDTFCMGTLLFCIFSFLRFWTEYIKNNFLKKVVKGIGNKQLNDIKN
jgi:small-conductance mechanosensitive channel